MDELRQLLDEICNIRLEQMIFSNSRDRARGTKVKVRPVLIKGELLFQETLYKGTQVFHSNLSADELKEKITGYLSDLFCQGELEAEGLKATVLVSKKGKITVKVKKTPTTQGRKLAAGEKNLSHDRTRQYILMDGTPVDFLIGLGVQAADGKIHKKYYDKFRQINRYLEFIEDVLDALPKGRTLRIIDFGCGKSYLTFAMYYYLHEKQGWDIEVTGLDLKTDVIRHCNELAQKLGYDKLSFEQGDISTYGGATEVDMVVSLHACDKATDYALHKAVKWGASVILAVPCCQHELNGQIQSEALAPVLKYGLIKERMAALLTDAIRANLLEREGYDTQILEFIDMEHTPKNLLIRAVKKEKRSMKVRSSAANLEQVENLFHVKPTLERLLDEENID